MQEQENKPVENLPANTVPAEKILPLATMADGERQVEAFITNFTGRGPEAAAFITQALATEAKRIDEMGSDVFHTKYYLAHVAEFISDKGECIPMPRVVLIGPNGETFAFVSEGGICSLDLIRSLCGDGPWEPPLPISVVKVRTRRGFFTYRLTLGGIVHGKVEGEVPSERSKSGKTARS